MTSQRCLPTISFGFRTRTLPFLRAGSDAVAAVEAGGGCAGLRLVGVALNRAGEAWSDEGRHIRVDHLPGDEDDDKRLSLCMSLLRHR